MTGVVGTRSFIEIANNSNDSDPVDFVIAVENNFVCRLEYNSQRIMNEFHGQLWPGSGSFPKDDIINNDGSIKSGANQIIIDVAQAILEYCSRKLELSLLMSIRYWGLISLQEA